MPKENREYWTKKIKTNVDRDSSHIDALSKEGWSVLTIWECETNNQDILRQRIIEFLSERRT